MCQGSLLSTSSPTLVISRPFYGNHPDRREVVTHCGFDLHFPDVERFPEPAGDGYVCFRKMPTPSLCPFLNQIGFFFFFFAVELYEFFNLSGH